MKPNTRYVRPIGPQFSLINLDKEMEFLGRSKTPIVIGLTGPTKAGKSQIAKFLVTEYKFEYSSLNYPLKDLSVKLGQLNPDWRTLGDLAILLRKQYSKDILAILTYGYIRKNFRDKTRIVIDGILHPAEKLLFENIFYNFYLIGITAKQSLRINHAKKWGVINARKEIMDRDIHEQVNKKHDNPFTPDIQECLRSINPIVIETFDRENLNSRISEAVERIILKHI